LQQEVNDEQNESTFGSKNSLQTLISKANKQIEESSSLMRKLENNK